MSFIEDKDLLLNVAQNLIETDDGLDSDSSDLPNNIARCAIALHPKGKRLLKFSEVYLAGRLLLGKEASFYFFHRKKWATKYLKSVINNQLK